MQQLTATQQKALRTGKSFEKALEIITKIYITETYV